MTHLQTIKMCVLMPKVRPMLDSIRTYYLQQPINDHYYHAKIVGFAKINTKQKQSTPPPPPQQ